MPLVPAVIVDVEVDAGHDTGIAAPENGPPFPSAVQTGF